MNPLIIWEKWKDPFGSDEEQSDDSWSDQKENENEDEESGLKIDVKSSRVMVTPMGLIPYSENTDASKIFKFWVAHTNFTISHKIVSIIEKTEGVETLDIYTRYRFRISVGKGFNDRDIMAAINKTLYSHIENTNDN